ncbi:U-scoloptoxin(16)-Er6a [Ixodes scapularis]|uniref:U-scoloptoxin(16)-Er6a n=1 Tax=Ixodes scapularis TaxID=6945 RepID=UPI001A9CF147|nr:U-scoloptoxin(16)-Er6a [Ixodes scapularis]
MAGFAFLSCCLAFALVMLCRHSDAYIAISPAKVKDGKCLYENFTIGDHESVHDDRHCHTLTCNLKRKIVTLEGCPSVVPHSHCWLDEGPHNGSYPDCCPKIMCDPVAPAAVPVVPGVPLAPAALPVVPGGPLVPAEHGV